MHGHEHKRQSTTEHTHTKKRQSVFNDNAANTSVVQYETTLALKTQLYVLLLSWKKVGGKINLNEPKRQRLLAAGKAYSLVPGL